MPTWAWVLVGFGALVAVVWVTVAVFAMGFIRKVWREIRGNGQHRATRDRTFLGPWNR